jgi:aromatic amino acid aminotransferase I / 2-aminoadipate transaminase
VVVGLIGSLLGMPDPTYFPFASISADALVPDAFPRNKPSSSLFTWFWNIFGASTERTERFTIPKFGQSPGDVDLATTLQYCEWRDILFIIVPYD